VFWQTGDYQRSSGGKQKEQSMTPTQASYAWSKKSKVYHHADCLYVANGVASLAKDKVSGITHSVTDEVRNSYASGKDHGATAATGGGGGGSGSPSSGSGSSPAPRRAAGELAQKLVYVKNSIPPESGGGGSATPNLNRGGE
jgi:hypothetical protein